MITDTPRGIRDSYVKKDRKTGEKTRQKAAGFVDITPALYYNIRVSLWVIVGFCS